ncbi:MAG: hypothetical protein PVH77_04275 [Phycisphaerales bacterium]
MFMMIPAIFKLLLILPLFLLMLGVIALLVSFVKLCLKRPWVALIAVLALLFLLVAPVLFTFPKTVLIKSNPVWSGDTPDVTTAIWLPGIEDEFKANVYPSKLSAVRSLGLRIKEPLQLVFGGQKLPSRIILFKGAHANELIEEFGDAITRTYPGTTWTVKPETAAVQEDEVGIRLDIVNVQTSPAPWRSRSMSMNQITNGTIHASVLSADKYASIKADFVEKPWVENLSGFLSTKPNDRFIIARSADSCMTEAEANHQAIGNACRQVNNMLGQVSRRLSKIPVHLTQPVNSADVLEGDLVLDRFVQSFEGTAGKIWRQALLIDASTDKLRQLARRKASMMRAEKMTLMKVSTSIFGLIILITIVYAFLNAATKGYYVWSLRIAGIVLVLVVIIFFLS